MSWTSMPPRTVPLRRTAGLATVTPMPARTDPIRPRRARHMATDTPAHHDDLTPKQRGLLYARTVGPDGFGRCEGGFVPDCWVYVDRTDWHACHRQNRSQGGHNTALWQRYVGCPPCHRWQGDHSDAARETGHYVRSGFDPRWLPICLPWGPVVRLGETGQYAPIDGGDAA